MEQEFITGAVAPCGVAVDAGYLYWGNMGTDSKGRMIGRARVDGNEVNEAFIDAGPAPCGFAFDH